MEQRWLVEWFRVVIVKVMGRNEFLFTFCLRIRRDVKELEKFQPWVWQQWGKLWYDCGCCSFTSWSLGQQLLGLFAPCVGPSWGFILKQFSFYSTSPATWNCGPLGWHIFLGISSSFCIPPIEKQMRSIYLCPSLIKTPAFKMVGDGCMERKPWKMECSRLVNQITKHKEHLATVV